MPLDERYNELNRRAAEAIRAAEQATVELVGYFGNGRPSPIDSVADPSAVARMRDGRRAAVEGLAHDDPYVRIVALDILADVWKHPVEAAADIRRLALSDPDREVQLYAINHLERYQPPDVYDADLYRSLAELATDSDDVLLRHSVHLKLCTMTGLHDISVLGVKYVHLPLFYDESRVEGFLTQDTRSSRTA